MKALALLVLFALLSSPLSVEAKICKSKNKLSHKPLKKTSKSKGTRCPVTGIQGNSLNGLPNTKLDNFVLNSGGLNEAIYGDEGSSGPPPYFGFGQAAQNQGGTPIYRGGLNTGRYHENYYLNRYDLRIGPSFWNDWRPLTGDFYYTLPKSISEDHDVAE